MMLDTIEKKGFDSNVFDINEKLKGLNKSFESSIMAEKSVYIAKNSTVNDSSIAEIIGLSSAEQVAENRQTVFQMIKGMYNGYDAYENRILGLKDLYNRNVNHDYDYINRKQQSGFAAEVISTMKENLQSRIEGTNVVTYRIDDLPDSIRQQLGERFNAKNDPYVDKIRIRADGTYETIQTKFVGERAKECFNYLKSHDYDKYFENGSVDKIEIPKEFYDEIKNELLPNEKEHIQNKIDELLKKGDIESAKAKTEELERLKSRELKIEKSTVTSDEAMFARNHPKLYSTKVLLGEANKEGLKGAKSAAGLTFVVSSAENIYRYAKGDISGQEAVETVFKDTAISGGIGYCLNYISAFTGSNVPATAITMGMSSYCDVKDFVKGDIDVKEFAYNLGENASRVAGGFAGALIFGATGPVGWVAGAVGGAVFSQIAASEYKVHVKIVSKAVSSVIDNRGDIVESAKDIASDLKDFASDKLDDTVDKLDSVKDKADDFKDYAGDKLGNLKDTAADKLSDFKDGAANTLGSAKSGAVKLLRKLR